MASSRSTIWLDANGFQTIHLVRTTAGATAITAALAAASNAARIRYWESPETTYIGPTPTAAPYLPGRLVAELAYQCADMSEAALRLPAPQVGIFLADGSTVDPANALVIAINAAAIGALVSSTGSPAVTFVSGRLQPL